MPEDSPNTIPIESIGDYMVQERLGSGAFADTFRVSGPDGAEYALKLLRPRADDEARLRFRNEVWALKALDHRSIPKYIADGTYEGSRYLVETLARGKSLRKLVIRQRDEGGPSTQMHVLSIASAVLVYCVKQIVTY